MNKSLQALIFDVDGTLAETERDGHRVAFNQAFAEAGLGWEWSVDLYRALVTVGGGKERLNFYLDHYHPNFHPPGNDRIEFIKDLHHRKTAYYQTLLKQIPLRPGVRRLISEAREEGLRLAIATTSTLINAETLIQQAFGPDALGWFEVIAAGDIVAKKKPAPDIYNYVLEQMALSPAECLVFEDTAQGLQAAIAAGLTTIITVHGYSHHEDFTGAALVLNHLGERDEPFELIQGDRYGHPYFDVALAQKIQANSNPTYSSPN
ncbi:MAG: HAD family hydrolase [Synechococcaceae cyanobacterium RL_1_2]|nr:HAD family hydrolase [Synechococcaceae cyanobacterium RL_1_2]